MPRRPEGSSPAARRAASPPPRRARRPRPGPHASRCPTAPETHPSSPRRTPAARSTSGARIPNLHELGHDFHAIRNSRSLLPTHGCREEVSHFELLGDLLELLLRLLVWRRAAACNHPNSRQGRQLSANCVGDTVGEIVVLGRSQVF